MMRNDNNKDNDDLNELKFILVIKGEIVLALKNKAICKKYINEFGPMLMNVNDELQARCTIPTTIIQITKSKLDQFIQHNQIANIVIIYYYWY